VCDPHEIANVLGVQGVRYMLDVSEGLDLSVLVMAPSCVPTSSMETSGAALGAEDLLALGDHPRVIGLAEVMNFPGVLVVFHGSTRRIVEGIGGWVANLVGDGWEEPSHGGLDRGAAWRVGASRGGVLGSVSGCGSREGNPVRG
jgi:hypothetical protein